MELRGLGKIPDDLGVNVGRSTHIQTHQRHAHSRNTTFLFEGTEVNVGLGFLEEEVQAPGLDLSSDLTRTPVCRDI
eukprot:857676-Pyramimonas_sp.AAC.1